DLTIPYILSFPTRRSSDLKTVNNMRFREYIVTIRLRVPVFGADFENRTIYDFTTNPLGSPVYPAYVSLLTRGSGFDGEHVLIVTDRKSTRLNSSHVKISYA